MGNAHARAPNPCVPALAGRCWSLFLPLLRCFSSGGSPHTHKGVVTGLQPAGLPHSEISGSTAAGASPELIAACHVLHRLREPRHPPRALRTLASAREARPLQALALYDASLSKNIFSYLAASGPGWIRTTDLHIISVTLSPAELRDQQETVTGLGGVLPRSRSQKQCTLSFLKSLERRLSSRTFPYGYLVTTSPQSPTPPSYLPFKQGRYFRSCRLPWRDGRCVQGPGTYSPRHG